MRIVLDRRTCDCWEPACETHFSWHFLRQEVTPIDCTVEIVDDGKTDLTFVITDRDGSEKTLVVNEENRADAMDSWFQVLEEMENQPY